MPSNRRQDSLNAITLLTQDHRKVQKLFKDFEKADRGDEEACIEIVETACAELKVHAMIEEEIFYPAVRSKLGDQGESLLDEAAVEHEMVDVLIDKLAETDPSDPEYAAAFTVLGEYVQHHIKEEEKQLFPKVRKLKELDLEELGVEMQARRDELLSEFESEETAAEDEAESEEKDLALAPEDERGDHKRLNR